MKKKHSPLWLAWAHELQAMGQTGLYYSPDKYHTKRYQRLIEIAAEIIHNHTGTSQEQLVFSFLAQPGYATPKVDVRGAVFHEGKVLLVRERVDGRWCLPGGWADVGNLPGEAVAREVFEESGFQVKPAKLIGLYDANRGGEPLSAFHAYKILFLCEIISGEARTSDETSAVEFYPLGELPPLSEVRTSKKHLAEAFAHMDDPLRPVAFD